MLNAQQACSFEEHGYVHLPHAFSWGDADDMAGFVWDCLSSLRGICRDDPGTWAVPAPWVGLNKFKGEPVFAAIGSPTVCGALDDLLGADGWRKPKDWGGFLVTFPQCAPEDWTIPAGGWHVDSHFTYEPQSCFALRVFTFLSDVGPCGGGTLVVSGSHRLVKRFVAEMTPDQRQEKFAVLKDRFNTSDPWLESLTQGDATDTSRVGYFMDRSHEIDGVQVRVEQLCGERGDVVIAHPWVLHTASPNAGAQPRFMLAKYIFSNDG